MKDNTDTSSSEKKTDEETLEDTEQRFFKKREDYRFSRNRWISLGVIAISLLIFLIAFFLQTGLSLSPASIQTLSKQLASEDFINNQFASVLSLSLSIAIIFPIIYRVTRILQTQKRNAELSSLGLQIRHLRTKITLNRQKQIFKKKEQQIQSRPMALMDLLTNDLASFSNLLTIIDEAYYREEKRREEKKSRIYEDIDWETRSELRNRLGNQFGKLNGYFAQRTTYAMSLDKETFSRVDNVFNRISSLTLVLLQETKRTITWSEVKQTREEIEEVLRFLRRKQYME